MDRVITCPICSSENIRTYYTEEQWLCEDHYDCDNCGYFDHMVYGSTMTGIDTISGTPEDRARKEALVEKNAEEISRRHLEINPEFMYYR